MKKKLHQIGKSKPRKEGSLKVTGQALYIDDLKMLAPANQTLKNQTLKNQTLKNQQMLHGITIRSKHPRAKIKSIEYLPGIPWNEFVIVSAKDVPARNAVALIADDQPYLADEVINHPEEPIVLLAHKDKMLAERARDFVKIHVEELPPVLNIDDSISCKQLIWGKNNVFKEFKIEKGEPGEAFKRAAHLIEAVYETGAQEHLAIETNGVIAVANPRDGVTVWGSMQCPYYVHKALTALFDLPKEKIRVIQTETGGGFGGKEEYPSILAGHAALLAWKSGCPVKIIYDRMEDMVATTKRHPSRTRHKTAVDKDGKIIGMEIDFILDGGAYCTLSPVVLSRGGIHATGPYFIPNASVCARAVATNTPPHGAFRGFGAPQSIFALEKHIDYVARKIGIDPVKFREINLIREGERTVTGQLIQEGIDMRRLMHRALKLAHYEKKSAQYKIENEAAHIKRGIGFACFMHGAGFTGSGERTLASIAGVEADANGQVSVLASSTEIGQGTNTVFSQIASDVLGIDYALVSNHQPDTAKVPDSGPTVASRTVMIIGRLVEKASQGLRHILISSGVLKVPYTSRGWMRACGEYTKRFGKLKSYAQYKQPEHINWDEVNYKGDAYATYAWAVYVAQVAIDTVTHETFVEDFVALQDVGRVIHPIMAAGQIQGGVAQAIGYALYERCVWKDGRMENNTMTNYIIPTTMDVPPIRVFFEETPAPYGPAGAKGIGELPMDGGAPAILNAIENALGTRNLVTHIPLVPEDLFDAMKIR